MVSDIAQLIFSFQNKINLFQRDINTIFLQLFPLLTGLVNSENDLCSEKLKVCVLRGWRLLQIIIIRPTFAFLVNPFVVDLVKDGCPVQKPIVTQTANIEFHIFLLVS